MLYGIGNDHPRSDDDIDLAGDHIGYQFVQALPTVGGVTLLDGDIATFLIHDKLAAAPICGHDRGPQLVVMRSP